MSARILRRRRSRESWIARIRTFWVLALLIGVGCAALVIALVQAPQLRVRTVRAIVPPQGPVSSGDVLAAAHVIPESNLWLLDTSAMRRRIEMIPYVLTARSARAQFPLPSIVFEVTLRRPTGCLRAANGVVTIDEGARVLQHACAAANLPLVDIGRAAVPEPGATLSAPDVGRLLADATTIGERVAVSVVRRDRFGGLEAVDTSGVVLRFGSDDDLAAKLALIEPIRRSAAQGRALRAIDLRAPNTPVVEFR